MSPPPDASLSRADTRVDSADVPYERASANDLVHLTYDRAPAPPQIGAILVLSAVASRAHPSTPDPSAVQDAPMAPGGPTTSDCRAPSGTPRAPLGLDALQGRLARCAEAVPRLRQRLRRVPLGCGRPIWVDDPEFDVRRHATRLPCPAPGDERSLLDLAARLISTRLPRDRPLWSATLVDGLADGRCAIILVCHHVLTDGQNALTLLANLADDAPAGSPDAGDPSPPRPTPDHQTPDTGHHAPTAGDGSRRPAAGHLSQLPSRPRLILDAFASRLRTMSRARSLPSRLYYAARELRLTRIRPAPRCSFNRPTGSQRALAVARADLAAILRRASTVGGTVNAVGLTAITGALHALLRDRGESVDELNVSVFVSYRSRTRSGRAGDATTLGNQVGVIPVGLPAAGPAQQRLQRISAITAARLRRIARATRSHKLDHRSTSAVLMEPLFRSLAALRLATWYFNRQRRVNTFVTSIRGPRSRLSVLGAPVDEIIPIPITAGNISAAFALLSYADTLVVTTLADPAACPDLALLTRYLARELDHLQAEPGARTAAYLS